MKATELGGPRRSDPRREPSDPPTVESAAGVKSQAAQVAEFRSSRYQIGVPAAVMCALITALSGALVAWINKPPTPATAVLTPAQDAALQQCAGLAKDVAELKATVHWIEPQIGLLLVRTDSHAYTPPPRPQP